jgi:LysM repeat protein
MKITKNILKTMIKKELNLLNEESYTVKKGDSLSKIAANYGTTVSDILRANSQFDSRKLRDWSGPPNQTYPAKGDVKGGRDRNPNWIYPGETIKLPATSPERPKAVQPAPSKILDAPPVPPTDDLQDIVDTETAREYKKECKDDILEILNALISVIDSMKKKVEKK